MPEGPPAAFVCLDTLTQRADFLAAAQARRAGAMGLNLQGRNRNDGAPPRLGYTATKKVGNAVARNRAKRRLRALAADILTAHAQPGWDYVLVAKPRATANRDWDGLRSDLLETLKRVHK